jgi:signal transduction histidine kinase
MRRTTVRVRLTVLYGGLFLLAGALLLTAMYLLVKQNLDNRMYKVSIMGGSTLTKVPASDGVSSPTMIQLPDGRKVSLPDVPAVLRQEQADVRDQTLDALLAQGGIALAVTGVAAIAFGWLMAERVLRPVHEITATARRVAASASADRGLHERIALAGPADEMKELADTFDDMLERLDRSFDGQRRFVANASHELRTPLAINRALAEVALTRPGANPDARHLAEAVLSVNARHERLIDGLLTLAASENGVPERVPVDLRAIAEHVLGWTDARGVELRAHHLAAAPVLGDPVLLERLTQNLVDNAIRHNRPGGWMSVVTGLRDGHAVLEVVNVGQPVAPYELESAFEPFRRLGGDRVRSDRGVGLGLSIVRAVARAHDGEASAAAGPDGGMAVTVRLPGDPGRR